MGKAITLAVAGIITAVLIRLVADEAKAWMPWLTRKLHRIAIDRLPESQRELFSEAWASHINDLPGDIAKVIAAAGCVWAAQEIACALTYGVSVRERIFNRLVGGAMLFLSAPLFGIIATLIKLECGIREDIFDRWVFTAADGESFTQYRFRVAKTRTHVLDANGLSSDYTGASALGLFLLWSGLSELPILINVLRGDVAFSGSALSPTRESLLLRVGSPGDAEYTIAGTFVLTNDSFLRRAWSRFLSPLRFHHIKRRDGSSATYSVTTQFDVHRQVNFDFPNLHVPKLPPFTK